MKTSAVGHHDLKYFCFVIKLKNVQCTIYYLSLSQNSGLLTVPDTQLLAVQREKKIKIDQGKVRCTPCTGTEAVYRPYGP